MDQSISVTLSAVLSIKIGKKRLMLVEKQKSPSIKPRPIAGRISYAAVGPDVWKIVRGLNGSPNTNSPNEAMFHNDRTTTNTKPNAKIFINHYVRVSKLHMTKRGP